MPGPCSTCRRRNPGCSAHRGPRAGYVRSAGPGSGASVPSAGRRAPPPGRVAAQCQVTLTLTRLADAYFYDPVLLTVVDLPPGLGLRAVVSRAEPPLQVPEHFDHLLAEPTLLHDPPSIFPGRRKITGSGFRAQVKFARWLYQSRLSQIV